MATANDLIGSLASTAIRAGLSGPAATFNSFINRAASVVTDPLNSVNQSLRSMANPYARQNTLERMQALPDPVLSCDWIAVVLGPTGEIPWEYIHTFAAPSMDVAVHEHRVNANMRKTASTLDLGTISVGLYTDRNSTALNWALSWHARVARPDGFYALPKDYYRDVQLFLLDAKRRTVIDFLFKDCFPTSISVPELSGDSGLVYTSLTLAVNDVASSIETDLTASIQRIGSMFPQIPGFTGLSI